MATKKKVTKKKKAVKKKVVEKRPVGRPLLYSSAEEMSVIIDEYFDFCDNRIQQVYQPKLEAVIEVINPAPYTMSGLALALDMDRKSLLNYSNKEEFFPTIRKARERVHNDVETRLLERNATGAMFSLKNNFDWVDKTETDNTHKFPKGLTVTFKKKGEE